MYAMFLEYACSTYTYGSRICNLCMRNPYVMEMFHISFKTSCEAPNDFLYDDSDSKILFKNSPNQEGTKNGPKPIKVNNYQI